MTLRTILLFQLTTALVLVSSVSAAAQSAKPSSPPAATTSRIYSDYLIGPEDVLGILFWRDKELSGDVTVRPDGIITILLVGEVQAVGKTPPLLAAEIQQAAERYLTEPNVTVIVRQINSRRIYITGEVNRPGAYLLAGPLTVMQVIALAGGVREFAVLDSITILREERGKTRALKFNYEDVARGRRLEQNFELQPGDTIIIP
jgi:polysaccharide export outer membrane protein